MFKTGNHDAAHRETVKRYRPEEMNVVGLALRDDKKVVDKITKGRPDAPVAGSTEVVSRGGIEPPTP